MINKMFGKIISAEFGTVQDRPFLVGLKLEFRLSDGTVIGNSGKYIVSATTAYELSNDGRRKKITAMVDAVRGVLKDSKVNNVSDLVGKPVEVTMENDIFKDFRILTEVL